MAKRTCPSCNSFYPDTQTDCIRCPDTPAALEPGSLIVANLMLGEMTATGIVSKTALGRQELTIIKVLGWGGMATAYLVQNPSSIQMVVKENRPNADLRIQKKLLTSCLREAEMQYKAGRYLATNPATFPPFPNGYGSFEAFGRLWVAMDFMEGEDFDRIQDRFRAMLPLGQVLQMGIEICVVLRDYLHGYEEGGAVKPIIHRDIKPANIQRLKRGGTACLLDFGIARAEMAGARTMVRGTRAGSEAFAPPEYNKKGVIPTAAFDIYCLCSSMWALLAYAKEFPDDRADQMAAIRATINDPTLQGVLIKGTQETPVARFTTAEELRLELVRVYEANCGSLPAYLRPPAPLVTPPPLTATKPPVAPTTTPKPVKPPKVEPIKIVWEKTPVTWHASGTQYEKVVAGWVVQGKQTIPNVSIIVARMIEIPGGNRTPNIAVIPADSNGYFTLDNSDTTMDRAVQERRLTIHVEDASGKKIANVAVTIKRPVNWNRVGSVAGSGAKAVGAGLGATRSALATSWRATLAAVGVLLVIAGVLLTKPTWWKLGGAILGVMALVWVGETAFNWWRNRPPSTATSSHPYLAFLAVLAGVGLMAITLFAARLHVTHPQGSWQWLWPNTFALGLMFLYWSRRLRKRSFGRAVREAFFNPATLLYYLALAGLALRAIGN